MRRIRVLVTSLIVAASILPNISPAFAVDLSGVTVTSSELVSVTNTPTLSKIYLNRFKPNETVYFQIHLHNAAPITIYESGSPTQFPAQSSVQFSLVSGAILAKTAIGLPIKEFTDGSGNPLIQIYPTPEDFPTLTLHGDTSLIAKSDILSTPVVTDGSYAIDSVGTGVRFFTKSAGNLIGFRKLSDTPEAPSAGGVGVYGYLEQKVLTVSATSPGTWTILDSNFNEIQSIGQVKTKYGTYYPEGHGITTSPNGNPVVIVTVPRKVDSSWLRRQYQLPILDCDIAEIHNGVAVSEFSFWDWAVQNKAVAEPLLDAMPLFNDPQDPKNSPIDTCHANSLQYFAKTHEYLISLRSPSILLILSQELKTVKSILPTNNALQHYARFDSPTEITALGNHTLDKLSTLLDFTYQNGKWNLKEVPFPVHVTYCGNTSIIDPTHLWLGGGCGPYTPGVLGTIYSYSASSGSVKEVGSLSMDKFNYSYRADLVKP